MVNVQMDDSRYPRVVGYAFLCNFGPGIHFQSQDVVMTKLNQFMAISIAKTQFLYIKNLQL